MYISRLILRNYRSYSHLDISFDKGLNIIVGDNGAGKTNIVEAIHFLSLARSFRTNETSDLIAKTCQFATIEAKVVKSTTSKQITAILTPSSKKIVCNEKTVKKISELSSLVNVLVFEPKDALMFIDSPLVRRNYLDINLSKKSQIYLDNLMRYEKLLRERNLILKKETIDKLQLEVITKQIIDVSYEIVKYRTMYISEINRILSKIISSIKGEKEEAHLLYEPFVKYDENFKSNATRAYERALESETKRKVTLIGIHREDMKMILNGKDIASFGSQGENRIAVIALKLAPYFLIDDQDERPIVVLDDVMSELDKEHRAKLIEFLTKFEQVFITATSIEIKTASIYEVDEHKVTRRNA